MAFFFTLLLFAATLLISEYLVPKPDIENALPAGLGDFQFPTATEGRPEPIVFGTVLCKGPNVVWYDDLVVTPIVDKVKTGLWSSKKVITGFTYKLGLQMAICGGRAGDAAGELVFLRVFIGENEFSNTGGANPLGAGISSGTAAFDNPTFFGGEGVGNGGVVGSVTFRPGSRTQSIPSYLSTHQVVFGKTPRYTDAAYALAERVEIGNTTQIAPWWFEVRRMPDPLGLGANNTVNSGNDLNPVSAIVELITNDDWGFKQSMSKVDTSAFTTAAATLKAEGMGISLNMDRVIDAKDLKRNIERMIDAVVFQDRATGLWTITLVRDGDASVLALNSSNVIAVKKFGRGMFNDTSNEVMTKYQQRDREYADSYGRAQDLGNVTQRGGLIVSQTVNYTGCKDPALAQVLADRDLLTLSYPLARATLVVNRDAWVVNPGKVVDWTDTNLGLVAKRFRVNKLNLGTILDGRITLDLTEDVFAIGVPAFSTPDAGQWTPPSTTLAVYDLDSPPQALIFEAPRAIVVRDPDSPTLEPRLWFSLRNKADGAIQYDIETSTNVIRGGSGAFMLMAEVATTVGVSGSTTTFEIEAGADVIADIVAQFADISAADVGSSLAQLVLIGDEFIGVQNITDLGSTLRFDAAYRAFLDSVPESHAIGDPVYLIFVGGGLTDGVEVNGTFRLITEGLSGALLDDGDAFSKVITLADRFNQPYPVARMTMNGSVFPSSIDWDTIQGSPVPFDGRGLRLSFVRRDFRLADEVAKHVDETSLPGDFPTVNTTEFRVTLNPDVGSTWTGAWASASSNAIGLSRAEAIWTFNDNPASIEVTKDVRHTVDAVVIQGSAIVHTFTIAGGTAGKNYLGRMDDATVQNFTAPDTGTYAFDIGADLLNGGIVEAQINGGGYSTVIAASGSSGSLVGVNATDSVDVRHTGVNGNADFALLLIDPPTSTGFLAPLRI